jgi:hypothetical protein
MGVVLAVSVRRCSMHYYIVCLCGAVACIIIVVLLVALVVHVNMHMTKFIRHYYSICLCNSTSTIICGGVCLARGLSCGYGFENPLL